MWKLTAAMALSLVLYGLIFGMLVHRPLTRGVILDMLEVKLAHLESVRAPQLVVLAGSNARFSHSCATLSVELNRPCTNMGVAAGVGLDLILAETLARLEDGDVIYLPLEYGQYAVGHVSLYLSVDAAERLRRDPGALYAQRGPEGLVRAALASDLSDAIQGATEMIFAALGQKRRFSTATLNEMGDETGHSPERAAIYRGQVETSSLELATTDVLFDPATANGARRALTHFIEQAQLKGVKVAGGLPTRPAGQVLTDELLATLRAFYEDRGAAFVELPSLSRYPLNDFYDTIYHLNESAARRHSVLLARTLVDAGLVPAPAR